MTVVRVAFDIGGVLSKYPDLLRPIALALVAGGAEVHIITDMPGHAVVCDLLDANGFGFIVRERVHCADYDAHGEGCKAVLLDALGIGLFLDDFVGYVAIPGGAVRCLVMPDASQPYYAPGWIVPGDQPTFGRKTFTRPAGAP